MTVRSGYQESFPCLKTIKPGFLYADLQPVQMAFTAFVVKEQCTVWF